MTDPYQQFTRPPGPPTQQPPVPGDYRSPGYPPPVVAGFPPPPLPIGQANPAQASRMEYDAFLSYAHRDKEVTSAIQKGLHQIGRRVGQLRALRVFRDDTNLTANPDLWAKINY